MKEIVIAEIGYIKTFNDDNGFIVFAGKDFDTGKNLLVKGTSFDLNEGDIVECNGKWINHPKFGQQFDAEEIFLYTPKEGKKVLQYLQSGYIKGIGKTTAERIFDIFGENSIEILDNNPEELKQVKGIGKKTLEKIILDWNEKRTYHRQNEELKELGFTMNEALKITKVLSGDGLKLILDNPYMLVTESDFSFSFDKIDKIAINKLRKEKNSPVRILTYLIYELIKNENFGNTYIEKEELFKKGVPKLGVTKEEFEIAYMAGCTYKKLFEFEKDNVKIVQSARCHIAETYIARKIKALKNSSSGRKIKDPENKIKEKCEAAKMKLSDGQYNAIFNSFEHKVNIINGGPGVGKTTALKILIDILLDERISFTLCAPTGKAAQRMSESTDEEAGTIHRTLEFNPQYKEFQRDESNPIETQYIVIDETSMVDIFMMANVLKAIQAGSNLIIIGDINQIPSISAGMALKDLIESNCINVSIIDEIQRQAKGSKIINNAYLVNNGDFFEYENKKGDDFFFIKTSSDENTLEKIKDMIKTNIPKAFNMNPKKDVQVLTPMHEGLLGRKNLNLELQKLLNGDQKNVIKRGDLEFRESDNVIQMKNNYDKEVFNGDTGEISVIGRNQMDVFLGDKIVEYERSDFDQLELAYSLTMHKSQGSEYPLVIIPISHTYIKMLDRSLLYTAITRGKKIVVIIGSEKNAKAAIRNEFSRKRKTFLKEKIQKEFNA